MAGRPKKKPEYNPELQFNNFLQELRDAYEEADSALRSLADELNISLLKPQATVLQMYSHQIYVQKSMICMVRKRFGDYETHRSFQSIGYRFGFYRKYHQRKICGRLLLHFRSIHLKRQQDYHSDIN